MCRVHINVTKFSFKIFRKVRKEKFVVDKTVDSHVDLFDIKFGEFYFPIALETNKAI